MELLVPRLPSDRWQDALSTVTASRPLEPFAPETCAFIQELSRSILTDKTFRAYPELMAMAHWMRSAQIQELKRIFDGKAQGRLLLPRGLALHFAPSNVDSIFIYSWFLSMLIGNCNVVRLSQRRGEQITRLLDQIRALLETERFEPLARRNLILSYGHDDQITQALSAVCQLRVIWGGDETIRHIRSIPTAPMATELVFADRFSLAALSAEAVLSADEATLSRLATDFYNDAYWFDQMACSSPRLVAWIGQTRTCTEAQARFWSALERVVAKKRPHLEPAAGIKRMTAAFAYAAQGEVDRLPTLSPATPYVAHLATLEQVSREAHSGGGLFLEAECTDLTALQGFVTRKDQTLAVYGFSAETLREFAQDLTGLGIDRIVPIGQALDFNWIWDGYDLMIYFTREVSLPNLAKAQKAE